MINFFSLDVPKSGSILILSPLKKESWSKHLGNKAHGTQDTSVVVSNGHPIKYSERGTNSSCFAA